MQPRSTSNSRGIDVSHYQTVTSWQAVKDAGISFVYAKASQGASSSDPAFKSHIKGARSVGIYAGAYHYLAAGTVTDAIAEADHFIALIAGMTLDLPPVLDVENEANTIEAALAFLQRFEAVTGQRPIVYTFPSFIDEKIGSALSAYKLWYAYYNAGTPANHGGWADWTFLQYSEHGRVNGISGDVDLDEFNGRLDDVFDEIKTLQAAVADLTGKCQTLLNTAEAHVERIVTLEAANVDVETPAWFTTEFGANALDGVVDTPKGPPLFWRLVTVALRLKRK